MEIIATMCGLIQSILVLVNKKENWIFYMGNIIALTIFSLQSSLYGDVLENMIYIAIGILGIINWYHLVHIKEKTKNSTISYCTNKQRVYYLATFFLISIICYFWLKATSDPLPILDAITTGMGLIATLLMAFKKIDSWVIWFIDDILMAMVYFSLPDRAWCLMTLNIVWVVLAVLSFVNWRKIYNKNYEKEKKN